MNWLHQEAEKAKFGFYTNVSRTNGARRRKPTAGAPHALHVDRHSAGDGPYSSNVNGFT